MRARSSCSRLSRALAVGSTICDSAAPDYSIAEVLSGRLLLGVQGDGSLANGMHSPLTFSLNSEH